ncbi:MAG: AMP-binding protein [Kineosporiaceae bacterium]
MTGARTALWVLDPVEGDVRLSYADLADRSRRVAAGFAALGMARGDRVLVMLENQVELWETILACIRLGSVVIPTATELAPADLRDRIERGAVRFVITRSEDTANFAGYQGGWTPISVGPPTEGWQDFAEAAQAPAARSRDAGTEAGDTLLLYFTSGTTARPKLVEHTHGSYPVGHLSTMYWIGLQPGDVHLNVASPGWAKHAWSTVFAPWNAAATVLALRSPRPDAQTLLSAMERCRVTTFCAMPTVWRMLAETPLEPWRDRLVLRELVGAGERLDATVIERVPAAWGLQIREGFGQTETTAQIGNPPGQPVRAGSMGRPLPGYHVAVLDPLMAGYRSDESRTAEAMYDGYYHTRDIVRQDADGYLSHVGRADEVFKAADVRISPFELESVLVAHPAVAEAAVVPSPDPQRRAVPKAFVVLAEGWEPSAETAAIILRHARDNLSVHNRITRLEFAELPKTMAGKVRRVALREVEQARRAEGTDRRGSAEFWAEDLAGL